MEDGACGILSSNGVVDSEPLSRIDSAIAVEAEPLSKITKHTSRDMLLPISNTADPNSHGTFRRRQTDSLLLFWLLLRKVFYRFGNDCECNIKLLTSE
jgi:hypothetical protein